GDRQRVAVDVAVIGEDGDVGQCGVDRRGGAVRQRDRRVVDGGDGDRLGDGGRDRAFVVGGGEAEGRAAVPVGIGYEGEDGAVARGGYRGAHGQGTAVEVQRAVGGKRRDG